MKIEYNSHSRCSFPSGSDERLQNSKIIITDNYPRNGLNAVYECLLPLLNKKTAPAAVVENTKGTAEHENN